MSKVELLAPGGSSSGIRAAVSAGADAVYAGGRLFGARAFSDNPDNDGILSAIDFCHLHGVKLYLTVNTLLKERELEGQLYNFILPIYRCGVDAILVQDPGVFHFLKKNFPDLPLHASTQMTIAGVPGARLLQEMGAARVVLSRELSLEEIRRIHEKVDVELETFVHGALCYCYSGQCLMSSLIGGRSGNRGRCAQPCRLPYSLYEGEGGRLMSGRRKGNYLLSLKDICTLTILPDLIDAGIASLKIEGRMKRPEYAAGVTAIYRKYIDLYRSEGRKGYKVDPEDMTALTDLFSRGGFSTGYYQTKSGPSMMTFEKPDHSGSPAAKRKESGNRTVLTALEHLYPGDSLRIGGREYLMKEEVSAGKNFTAQGASGGSKGEVIMRLRARHLLDTLSESYVEKQPALEAEAAVFLKPGEPLKIKVTSGEATVTASGAVVEKAQKVPLSEETVRKQAGKTGDTLFAFRRIDVRLEGACFCPVSEINRVRREALEQLEEKLLSEFRRNAPAGEHGAEAAAEGRGKGQDPEAALEEAAEKRTGFKSVHPKVTASVLSEEQLQAVLASDLAGGVYVDASMFVYPASEKPEALISRIHQAGKKAYLALPYIYREETGKTLEHFLPEGKMKAFDGILVRSADEMGMLREWNVEGEIIADAGVYTWNREAAEEVRRLGATWDTIPYELTARELSGRDLSSSELVVYGRTPLMVTAQCLRKNTSGCTHQPSVMTLVDRKGIGFPVRSECAFCQNIIYNSVPTELLTAEKEVSMLKPASVRYSFTTESREETEAILKGQLPGQITRGHIRKGVE